MRIAIPSLPSPESVSLKAILEQAGYLIVTDFPSYTVTLKQGSHPWVVVDVPDAPMGRLLTHRIGELAPWNGVFVKAAGGNQNDKAAVIEIPDNDAKAVEAVCIGTMRALDQWQKQATDPAKAAQPFYNASELLVNAVETLKAHVSSESRTLDGTMRALTSQTAALVKQTATTTTQDLIIAVGQESEQSRLMLFADLMGYYSRPRIWQWRYWFPHKT